MNLLAILLTAISLTGTWQFHFEEKKSIEEVRNLEFTADDVMSVPGCWDMMPRYYLKRGTALYRKTFYVDETMKDAVLEVDELIQTIRNENSGRLITFACNNWRIDVCHENTDLIAFNAYPGTIPMQPGEPADLKKKVEDAFTEMVAFFRSKYPDKPIMISESGMTAEYGMHDPAANVSSEEMQVEYLRDIFETLWSNPDVVGFALWQMNDNRTYSRTSNLQSGKVNMGFSTAGIYDLYRRAKLSVPLVKDYFSKK